MTSTASEKQVTANRKNALLGGVKTTAGKAVSSRNATKFGIFSKTVVLEEIEDEELYKQFRAQYFEELQPIGIVESTLVDRMVSLQWRLARVPRAERAMIEKGRLEAKMKHRLEEEQHVMFHAERPSLEYVEHFRKSLVTKAMMDSIDTIVMVLDLFGLPLGAHHRTQLERRFGATLDFPHIKHILDFDLMAQLKAKNVKLEQFWEDRLKDPNLGEDEKESLIDLTNTARNFAGYMQEVAKVRFRMWEEMEMKRDWAEEDERLMPPEKELLAIHRAESSLHRMFMHCLHELQRLQSARMGKQPPLAAALDVNMSNENGFDL